MEFLLFGLLLLGIPFVLPIALWVMFTRLRGRVEDLERDLNTQTRAIEALTSQLRRLQGAGGAEGAAGAEGAVQVPVPVPVRVPVRAAPAPPTPSAPAPAPAPIAPAPIAPAPIAPAPAPIAPAPAPSTAPSAPPAPPAPPAPAAPPAPPAPSSPAPPPFDWESLVGVKLFSAIAGIALVFAAVFFLRYSVQQGWLQPPVRVLIGIAVAITLLVLCEMKAARKYPVTANALDAAAIAILFSTFFAAHALWNLIPASVTFGLLGAVTALAVLLSIRRESLFIAVLGLLGGFATPALLSTGENRPVPLFAYLLLLNIGLAWVAYRKTWPILTVLTLVLTTAYQWGWVFKFLHETPLPIALAIFLIFPLVSIAGVVVARRPTLDADDSIENATFERSALIAAVLPLFFAVFLAAVPAYGATPLLLFGFLAMIDVGLLAIAIARRQTILHAAGALATAIVAATWIAISYRSDFALAALAFTVGFAAFFLAAPAIARRFDVSFEGASASALFTAPILLFVPVALARIEPRFAAPFWLFLATGVVLLLCAWRAMATGPGLVYFIAAFFAVAVQGVWSATHLTLERLWATVAVYALFGIAHTAVPVLARRIGRTLQPEGASGGVLLASLGLLFFLSTGGVAPEALWAFALLLTILNAGLFIESAAASLPVIAQAATVGSFSLLALWWTEAGAAVGVIPSLAVMTMFTLVTLAGHALARRSVADRRSDAFEDFTAGLYLALIGHAFLFFLAFNRQWSLPPWPLFGSLAVLTLAVSATSFAVRVPLVHAGGVTLAALIVAAWTMAVSSGRATPMPWAHTAIAAAVAVSLYALGWIPLFARIGTAPVAAAGAAATLFVGAATLMALTGERPEPFVPLLAAHAFNFATLLALTYAHRWRRVATATVLVAWVAIAQHHILNAATDADWVRVLVLTLALYAIFTVYPIVASRRDKTEREPWIVALIAAAMTFFAARDAVEAGGYAAIVGVVPVVLAVVTAILLRALLAIERAGERDLGRLALVAGAALAFVTVAIPLQLEEQWITIGWALEGAALAWLFTRIPHRGLMWSAAALFAAVFVRLALNPEIFLYEPRGPMRILNWYLYTYAIAAVSMFAGAWWFWKTDDRIGRVRLTHVLSTAAGILLFLLLNIEIADFYATGPEIAFRFGASLSQDLTYTIGWLVFGLCLLAAGIYMHARPARITAVALIAITTFKCFLYDLRSLEGLYRVAAFVGLAISLALVSLALQKYVLAKAPERTP